jgi:hypothetical protein
VYKMKDLHIYCNIKGFAEILQNEIFAKKL